MKNIKEDDNNLHKIIDSIIHIIVYALILLIISTLFNTLEFNKEYFGIYYIIASIIIFILNKTIKPILFRLTIPITGITLGLFYPCINVLILKITDLILGNKFETNGIITLFFTAILISIMNKVIDNIIIKKIIRKGDNKWVV